VFALDTARHLSIGGRYLRPMAIPDRWVSWWPAGVWRGLQIIRQQRPAVIMSTFPIATAHMIALTLRRRSGLPWVADFRDNMTDPGFPRDPLTWRFNRRLEAACVRHCSKSVFTTRGALEMYAERYPEIPASRWSIVENGYVRATQTLTENKARLLVLADKLIAEETVETDEFEKLFADLPPKENLHGISLLPTAGVNTFSDPTPSTPPAAPAPTPTPNPSPSPS